MTAFFFVLGLMVGSFINVLADRLPVGENVLWGRSHCDYCKKTLHWYELVPVLSFLIQGGRSRCCRKKLSAQYPAVELATAIFFGFIAGFSGLPAVPLAGMLVVCSSFLVIFIADCKYQIIPDSMVIMALAGSVFVLLGTGADIRQHVVTGVTGMTFFYLLWLGTHGRGMGFGDVKLAGVLGVLLGYPLTIIALYVAFLTGAICGVILILAGLKRLKSKIAFGPFLLLGTVAAYVFNSEWMKLWQSIF